MCLRNREMSLMRAILFGVVGLITSIVLLAALLAGFSMENFMTYTIDRSNKTAVEMLIPQVNHYFEHPESVASSLKVLIDEQMIEGVNSSLAENMNISNTEFIRRVERVSSEGLIVDTYPLDNELIGLEVNNRSFVFTKENKSVNRTETFVDPVLREPTMAFKVSLSDGGSLIVYPDLTTLQSFLSAIELTGASRIGIVDPNGVFVAHNIDSFRSERYTDPLYQKWKEDKTSLNEAQLISGERYRVSISAIDQDGWALIVYQSVNDLREDVFEFLKRILLGLLLIGFLGIGSAYTLYKRILSDMNHLEGGVAAFENSKANLPIIEFKYIETGRIYRLLSKTGSLLHKREAEIHELNKTLERRVVDRTMELEAMNEELIATIDELQMTQDQLVEAKKMAEIGRVVSGVAHEMNTPLGNAMTISTFLNKSVNENGKALLNGNMSRADASEWMDEIQSSLLLQIKALERSAQLVHEFKRLDVSRKVAMDWIDIEVLFEIINRSHKHNLEKVGGKLIFDVTPARIYTDPEILREVVNLLIENAIQHAYEDEESKPIRILGSILNGEYIIEVNDYGCGMDDDECKLAFHAFEAGQRKAGHTGLGLFVVGTYVRNLLSGEVKCISQLNEGTTVKLKLKLHETTEKVV